MDLKAYRRTGAFGLAVVVLWLSQFPLYMAGSPPSVYDGASFGQHLLGIKNVAFTRILLDQGAYAALIVFAVGFRQLIRKARSDHEWIGDLVFGAAIVWMAVTLVADGLEGGAVLDALSGKADSSSVRALIEGTLLIYNGSTAFALTAVFLGAAGCAIFTTRVLPRWTGFAAYVAAALCVACIPAMYFGPVNYRGFYNAGGWGPAIIANFPPAIWFLAASISMISRASSK
ncbi:MAG TPA: hypothetical protein VLZ81_07020 [Blastocatellia bacterium]|nr:hypothetical protein [Blastocatellia bacterium]